MRSTAERRHNDWKKAIRKRKIANEVYCLAEGWYNNLHQYSKNKVHCSCAMCRKKTNNKHRTGSAGYEPLENWSMSDKRKLESLKDQDYEEQVLETF